MRHSLACLTTGLMMLFAAGCGSTARSNGDGTSPADSNATGLTGSTGNAGGSTGGASSSETATTGAGGRAQRGECRVTPADPIPEDVFPEVLAAALCGWYEQCNCSSPHAGATACEQSVVADLMARRADAQARGLTYDANCPGEVVKYHDSLGCGDNPNGGGACYVPACAFYHGATTGVCGAASSSAIFESDCAPGMICKMVFLEMDNFTTGCFEQPLGLIQEGERGCGGLGTACFGDAICVEGTCRAPVGLGEPCYGSTVPLTHNCRSGFCNEEQVCESARDAGLPCVTSDECQSTCFATKTVCAPHAGSSVKLARVYSSAV